MGLQAVSGWLAPVASFGCANRTDEAPLTPTAELSRARSTTRPCTRAMRSSVRVKLNIGRDWAHAGARRGRGRQAGVADAGLTDAVHPINTTITSPRRQRPSAEAEAAQADAIPPGRRPEPYTCGPGVTNRCSAGIRFSHICTRSAAACAALADRPTSSCGPENNRSMADEEKRRNRRSKQGLTEEQVRATVRLPARRAFLHLAVCADDDLCAPRCLLLHAAARNSGGLRAV